MIFKRLCHQAVDTSSCSRKEHQNVGAKITCSQHAFDPFYLSTYSPDPIHEFLLRPALLSHAPLHIFSE